MENNEIMEKLLQDDKVTSSNVETTKKAKGAEESHASRVRVVTAKYKLFIVVILIFIALLWLIYIPNVDKSLKSKDATYNNINAQLTSLNQKIDAANKDMSYLCDNDGIISNEKNLKNCLDGNSECEKLPADWKEWSGNNVDYTKIRVPLSYLQLHSLYNKKMPVDEKVVLKNLNEYLIKQDISWLEKEKVWEILRIEIWDPEIIWYRTKESPTWNPDDPVKVESIPNFFAVPVDTKIEFWNVDELVGFLSNIEKKMIENGDDRILYKIQSVSYDIITNDEPQITDISMIAYYYHDERFDFQTFPVIVNINGDNIKLQQEEWNDLPSNISLKEQITKKEQIEAKDLVVLPEWFSAEFKNWKWIDTTAKWNQRILINIWRIECTEYNTNNDSDKWDNGVEEDSESFFDKMISIFN